MAATDRAAGPAFDPFWSMADDTLDVLLEQVRHRRPAHVVELGSGRSTLSVARLLRGAGARLTSVEHDPAWARTIRGYLEAERLEDVCEIVDAPLRRMTVDGTSCHWYELPESFPDVPWDMLVVDGPPNPPERGGDGRYPALPRLAGRARADALVLVDDAHRDGERRMLARWIEHNAGWSATFVPTTRGCALLQRTA